MHEVISGNETERQDLRQLLEEGDADGLRQLLAREPRLARAAITWGDGQKNVSSALDYLIAARFHGLFRAQDPLPLATLLIDTGAEVNARGSNGETPLHGAVSLYELELAQLLIEYGADLEAQGGCVDEGTPLVLALHFAARLEAEMLWRSGAQVFNLPMAAGLGDPQLISRFLGKDGALLPAAGNRHPEHPDDTSLWNEPGEILAKAGLYAALNGRLEALEQLVDAGLDPKSEVDGASLLHWAAWWGEPESINRLLALGADPEAKDHQHASTPAQWACHRLQSGWAGLTRQRLAGAALAEQGAKLDLHTAAGLGLPDAVELALHSDGDSATVLHRLVEGGSVLHRAALAGDLATVQLLVARGANTSQRTAGSGKTAAELARMRGHQEVARWLATET